MTDNNLNKKKSFFFILLNYILIPLACLASSLYVLFWNQREEYNLMFLLPIAFLICYEIFLKNSFNHFREFSICYTIVSFIRYVVTPLLIVLGGRYDGRSSVTPSTDSFILAFVLMIFELLVCSITIWLLNRKLGKLKKNDGKQDIIFPKHWIVYAIFIGITLVMAILRPNNLNAFSFIFPNENLLNYDDFDTLDQIVIMCLSVSKNLLALMILSFCYKKRESGGGLFWVIISFVIIILNSAVYFGTNRFDFLLNLTASTILFCMLYKKFKRFAIIVMAIFGVVGFLLITQARNLRGAIDNDNEFYQTADLAQMYFGGPYNVAIAIETADEYPEGRNIKTVVYDCTRSVLGLNIIVRNMNGVELSSYYFNRRIFNNSHSSQIIPMIGEGYYLFGAIFSPVLDIIFIMIAYCLKKSKKGLNIEIGFFFIITLVRLGFINCQSATIQLNDMSFNLFLPLVLAFLNGMIKTDRNKRIIEAECEK